MDKKRLSRRGYSRQNKKKVPVETVPFYPTGSLPCTIILGVTMDKFAGTRKSYLADVQIAGEIPERKVKEETCLFSLSGILI